MMNAVAISFFILAYFVGLITNNAGYMLSCCVIGFAVLVTNPKNKVGDE